MGCLVGIVVRQKVVKYLRFLYPLQRHPPSNTRTPASTPPPIHPSTPTPHPPTYPRQPKPTHPPTHPPTRTHTHTMRTRQHPTNAMRTHTHTRCNRKQQQTTHPHTHTHTDRHVSQARHTLGSGWSPIRWAIGMTKASSMVMCSLVHCTSVRASYNPQRTSQYALYLPPNKSEST